MHRRSLLLGVLVPLALLAGQVSTVAHSMLVEHQRCPEHGELIHRTAHEAPALGQAADLATSHDARMTAGPSSERDGDDHCVSLAARREIAGSPARISVDLAPPPSPAVPVQGSRSSHGRGALLLRMAPKTSPPLAA